MLRNVGADTYRALKALEELVETNGFRLEAPSYRPEHDSFSLVTQEGRYPPYITGAELYAGDMVQCYAFIQGLTWAIEYYGSHLKLFEPEDVARAEQDIRNEQLMDSLRNTDIETVEDDIPF